jgi:protein SCO1/2
VTTSRPTERLLVAVLLLLLAAIGAVLLTSGGSSKSSGGSPFASPRGPLDGPTLPAGVRAANFSLLDQDGRRVTLQSFRGRVVVLTFMHSQCHGACPLMAEQIKGALNSLPREGTGIPAIAISVDPAQDTRTSRAHFLAKYGMTGRLEYLNGPRTLLRQIWHAYAVQPLEGSGTGDDHSAFVFLIDRRGYERVGFPVTALTPEALAHDIATLQRQRA